MKKIEKKPEEQKNPEKKEEKDENKENNENNENMNNEEKTVKVHYKDGTNDKTSYSHIIFYNGVDIDINTKKIIECYENVNKRNFLLFTKKTNIKTLLFIEEQYLYLLKDVVINKKNENLRRISNRFDLNKLFDYNVTKQDKNYLFTFDFIKNENLLDRNVKNLLFTQDDGERFEEMLIDTMEKYEVNFLEEIFEDQAQEDEEEEDEKEEKDDSQEKDKDNAEKKEDNQKDDNKEDENKDKKKEPKRIILEDTKENDFKKSSSREIL